jgi:signal transduction histidine kinase
MYLVNMGMSKDRPERLKEGWEMVQRNIQKVSDLVLDLLRYSKERVPQRSACNPNEIVSDAMELFRERAKEYHVKLRKILDPNLTDAYIDPEGIHNVVLNLISNAIDACIDDTDASKAWEVTVKTQLERDAKSGDDFLLEIRDNGCGMTDEVKQKLFTKFFSTKAGRGTGLGLLGTQKIVHEHGGEISVESRVGQGTTLSVRLKRAVPQNSQDDLDKPQKDTGT